MVEKDIRRWFAHVIPNNLGRFTRSRCIIRASYTSFVVERTFFSRKRRDDVSSYMREWVFAPRILRASAFSINKNREHSLHFTRTTHCPPRHSSGVTCQPHQLHAWYLASRMDTPSGCIESRGHSLTPWRNNAVDGTMCVHVPFKVCGARTPYRRCTVYGEKERGWRREGGGGCISPSEQRIIAVEWHDHTDGWKGRSGGRQAGRQAERAGRKRREWIKSWTDRTSEEKSQGRRRRSGRNMEWRAVATSIARPAGIVPARRKYPLASRVTPVRRTRPETVVRSRRSVDNIWELRRFRRRLRLRNVRDVL